MNKAGSFFSFPLLAIPRQPGNARRTNVKNQIVELSEQFRQLINNMGGSFKYIFTTRDGRYLRYNVVYYCVNGHRNVKRYDSWRDNCEECRKMKGVEIARALGKEKGMAFLSQEYTGVNVNYKWKCPNGHIKIATYNNVKVSDKGCRQCDKDIMDERNKRILQDKDISIIGKLGNSGESTNFQCKRCNYTWATSLSHIVNDDSGCRKCNRSSFERHGTAMVEFLFKQPFHSVWPDWLISSNDTNLQLDAYNEPLHLAVEFNGNQHVVRSVFFQKTEADFEKRKKYDQEKIELCKKNGVVLIIIPYITKFNELYTKIRSECIAKYPNFPIDTPETIDTSELDLSSWENKKLEGSREILNTEYPGSILNSKIYIDGDTPYDITCKNGHKCSLSANQLKKRATLCKLCEKDERINNMDTTIEKQCEKCFLKPIDPYTNSKTLYKYQCLICNQIVKYTWNTLRYLPPGALCKQHNSQEERQIFYQEKGLKLVDNKYIDDKTKHNYTCITCNKPFQYTWSFLKLLKKGGPCNH